MINDVRFFYVKAISSVDDVYIVAHNYSERRIIMYHAGEKELWLNEMTSYAH